MLITLILLIAMLGAIILATGSVEEGNVAHTGVNKNITSPAAAFNTPIAFVEDKPCWKTPIL